MSAHIRTRYVSHPGGSNVGNIRATARGTRAEIRCDQSLYMVDNHRAAAAKLAGKLGLELAPGETATDTGYLFLALEPAAPGVDDARRIVSACRAGLITRDEMATELAALHGLDIRCLMGECTHAPEVSR